VFNYRDIQVGLHIFFILLNSNTNLYHCTTKEKKKHNRNIRFEYKIKVTRVKFPCRDSNVKAGFICTKMQ